MNNIRNSFVASSSFLEGVSTFSCDENSRDLSPLVHKLENMIRARVSKGPLVVLTSEVHPVASNIILPQLLMERLQDLKVAQGIERSHDLLERLIERQTGSAIPDAERGKISALDKDGSRLLEAYLQTALLPNQPKSDRGILTVALPACHRNIMEYCKQRGISVRAVDAAGSPDGSGELDITDPSTLTVVNRHAPHLIDKPISNNGPAAIWMRNEHAAEKVIEHMRDTGANVYMLPYGGAHLCGWRADGDQILEELPAPQSLNAIFEREGIDVMTVFLSYKDKFIPQNIPGDANPEWLRKGVVVNGINPSSFWQDPKNSPEVNAHLALEEGRFLVDVLTQSGSSFIPSNFSVPVSCALKNRPLSSL